MDDATAGEIGRKLRLIEFEKDAARRKPVTSCGKCSASGWVAYAKNRDGSEFYVECRDCGNPMGNADPTPRTISFAASDVGTIRHRMKEIAENAATVRIAAAAAEAEEADANVLMW